MRGLAIAAVFATLATARPASAESCPAIRGGHPALSQVDPETRYRFLEQRMRKARRHARIWNYGWTLGFLGASGGLMAVSPLFEDQGFREGLYTSAGKALVAGLFGIVRPLKVFYGESPPAAAGRAACERLHKMERALLATARREQGMKGWKMWVAGFALNLAGVVVLAARDRWREAALSVVSGTIVAQVRMWTQPAVATETLRDYRAGRFDQGGNRANVTIAPGPSTGLSLRVDF